MTYPAPWQAILDGIPHSDVARISLWHRIVDAINNQEGPDA